MSEKPAVSSDPSLLSTLHEGRRQFLALVEGLRPELHRYCARMTGSVIDGEDVVQESLARAYYELSELRELPALRAWLFRIAHNRALDLLRARQLRTSEPLEAGLEVAAGDELEPENALAREQAVHAAVSRFLELPPAQRSCVILMDVLEHSLEEIAALLELSIPAVKAALHRGRATLRELAVESQPRLVRSAPSPATMCAVPAPRSTRPCAGASTNACSSSTGASRGAFRSRSAKKRSSPSTQRIGAMVCARISAAVSPTFAPISTTGPPASAAIRPIARS